MKICFLLGLLAVFINVFDMFIVDIPFIYANATSLTFGAFAMILGALC